MVVLPHRAATMYFPIAHLANLLLVRLMLKPSICNLFARPLTTLLAHFWAKLIFYLLLYAKQQKINFGQK